MTIKLTLKPKRTVTEQHNVPQVRELTTHLEALNAKAQEAGVTTAEALRQIVAHFVENPFPLDAEKLYVGYRDSRALSSFHMDPATLGRFLENIERQGVTFPNAVRQLIRRFLEVS